MPRVFKEDFFERMIDVQWVEEKKVWWMAGDAQGATYNYGCHYYTSDDGKHWSTHKGGNGVTGVLFGFTSGMWMRESFNPDANGLWILGGEGVTEDHKRKSGIQISRDGLSLGETRWFDNGRFLTHFVGLMFADDVDGKGGGTARLESTNWDHADTFTSKDGISWTPDHYHADATTTAFIDPKTAPSNRLILPTDRRIILPHFDIPPGMELMTAHDIEGSGPPNMMSLRAAPREEETKKIKINDLYQLSNRFQATGPLREGKLAGKTVTLKGGAPHGFHGPGTPASDYFESGCTVVDAYTGEQLSKTDCGVHFGHSIAYGYYVFVVAGGDQAGNSLLSYTEDGKNWEVQDIGSPSHSMWSLVVGPRNDLPRRNPDEPEAPTGATGPAPPERP